MTDQIFVKPEERGG